MRRSLALLLFASVATLSCYTAGVDSPVGRGQKHDDTGVTWFWGISNTITDAQECHKGLARVETSIRWYTYIVAPLTLGIITPIKKDYICAE